jgi:hypothetical protein
MMVPAEATGGWGRTMTQLTGKLTALAEAGSQ